MASRSAKPGAAMTPFLRCVRAVRKGLSPLLQSFFESVDDALFDMAEKAENNAQQTHYFDGMREVRRKRSDAEQTFEQEFEKSLKAFRKGEPLRKGQGQQAVTEDDLTLVDEQELEESLAISEMAAKGENRLSRSLHALSQRLGAIQRSQPPGNEQNPLAPLNLSMCFKVAADQFDVELPVLIVIYKLFDKHVLEELGGVYDKVNQELIAAGVLPQLRGRARQATPPPAGDSGQGQPAAAPGPAVPDVADTGYNDDVALAEEHAIQNQLVEHIVDLLSVRRQSAPPPVAPTARVETNDLINALSILQAEQLAQPQPVEQATGLKDLLLAEVAKLTDTEAPGAGHEDENTIDLVAMLFDFILQDRNLPDHIQVLLSRLQIPYIKVALLDGQLFASRSHPARLLLDDLASAGVGWSEGSDRGQKLYSKMDEIVEKVVSEFDDDLVLFDELREDFTGFMQKSRRRADVAEKRTAEATEGKQRLEAARQHSARAITERIDQGELPNLIDELLRKPWANVLVLTELRHGEDSEELARARSFVDDLVWTAEPKTTAADVARLQSLLPHLSKQLRAGLEMVAYHEDDIRRVFGGLKKLYQSMIDTQYREQLTLPDDAASPKQTMDLPEAAVPVTLPVSGAGDMDQDIMSAAEEAEEVIPPEDLEAAYLEKVEQAEVGTWFEFTHEDRESVRAKLSWKSPITSRYLFVDQKGLKVADKHTVELAQELARGEATILEAVPLVDRALGAIANQLKGEKPGSHEEAAPADSSPDPSEPSPADPPAAPPSENDT